MKMSSDCNMEMISISLDLFVNVVLRFDFFFGASAEACEFAQDCQKNSSFCINTDWFFGLKLEKRPHRIFGMQFCRFAL